MSYVPPHKRHENVSARASSVPPSLLTKHKNTKIIHANDFISRWFLVGSEYNNSFQLVPVSSEWRRGSEDKPLVMLLKNDSSKLKTPWLWVAEKVENDLILGFGRAKETLIRYASEDVNLRLIARFGKVVFNRSANSSETLRDDNLTKRVFDNTRLDITNNINDSISIRRAELNALRHLNIDVSCLDQDLDMRLSVDSKRTLTNLSENEIKSLKELTDSAVIDPNVKGGLKWPLGKSSCGDRYSVCGVWHTVTNTYRNQTLRLQVLEANRYDFRTGIGGTSREVFLKLRALSKLLKEENGERKCVTGMLKDCLKTVWDYFLNTQV
ncbi:hypothetical protein YC2023_102271 [Brassica napus]